MEQQPINLNQNPVMMPEPQKKSMGPMIGLLIILIVIILGGLYFWNQTADMPYENTSTDELGVIQQQGTSDEVSSIETDLQATVIDSIDTELGNIDAELQAQ